MSEIIETKAICKQNNRYIGWPTIACAPDGTLHAVFSGDRDGHICPFGKSYLMSSRDVGNTWSEPQVVNNTPMDDRDTGLCILPDGTMVMSWFTSYYYRANEVNWNGYWEGPYAGMIQPWSEWEQELQKITRDDIDKWTPFIKGATAADSEKWDNAWKEMGCVSAVRYDERFPTSTRRMGHWTRRSHDGGETWDQPTLSPGSAPHGPNVLPDGRLIYVGVDLAWSGNSEVAVSPDLGLTWTRLAVLNSHLELPGGVNARLGEPHVVATPSGRLVALARFQAKLPGEERFLWQFDSEDGGHTWTEPRPSTLNGYPPHLLRVGDGRLLASFSVRHKPLGHRFCFSHDEGKSWATDGQLQVDIELGDHGYVSTAEVLPGHFVSVYYQRDREGEKPCLMMTRWKG